MSEVSDFFTARFRNQTLRNLAGKKIEIASRYFGSCLRSSRLAARSPRTPAAPQSAAPPVRRPLSARDARAAPSAAPPADVEPPVTRDLPRIPIDEWCSSLAILAQMAAGSDVQLFLLGILDKRIFVWIIIGSTVDLLYYFNND